MRPALFLDRDGVVNVDHGYVHRADNVEFIDGIFELVQLANRADFTVVIVTNQAGIARGFYTEQCFQTLSIWMMDCFSEAGARIDAIYHCPHHPTAGLGDLRRDCTCRKPSPGMLLQAIQDLSLSPERSILVGDKESDIAAGASAGIGALFLLRPKSSANLEHDVRPDAIRIIHLLDQRLISLIENQQSQSAFSR